MWYYKGNPITALDQLPDYETQFGFVYLIKNKLTGKIYIGKKNFRSSTTKPALKKEYKLTKSGAPHKVQSKRKIVKESDWLKYWSSCDVLIEDVKQFGADNFHREILELTAFPRTLSYLETRYQFDYKVLEIESYNRNILGKFFNKDVQAFLTT